MKKTLLVFLFFYTIIGYCQNLKIDSILIKSKELPAEFKSLNNLHCQSIQSKLLYNSPQTYSFILGNVINKQFQSFEYEDNLGSILYFEFNKETENSKSFIERLIWGGKKPSKSHPENIFTKDRILIITSFPYTSKISEILNENILEKIKL